MAMGNAQARIAERPTRIDDRRVRHGKRWARPRGLERWAFLGTGLLLLGGGSLAGAAERDLSAAAPTPVLEATSSGAREDRPGEALPRPADLHLVWFDPTNSLAEGFEIVAADVQSIFRGLGVESTWRVGGGYGEAPGPEVPVILLARDPLARRVPQRVLGLVLRDQEPQRAVWLFLENVRFTLGHSGKKRRPEARRAAQLARAVARVAAHEIIHAIAPDEPHAETGLMRHALDRHFLTAERASIDARCAASFVTRLAEIGRERLARSNAGVIPAGR
jgi:hypothetical protein